MNPLVLRFLPYLLVLIGLVGGGWYLHHLGYKAGAAKVTARWEAATQEAGSRFAAALEDQQAKLIAADKALTDVRRQTRTTREQLDDALQDPSGASWGDTPVPVLIRVPLNASRRDAMPGHPGVADDPVRDERRGD
jgi:hypothetical protein